MKECPSCKCCLPDSYDRCPTDGSGLAFSFMGDPLLEDRYQLEHYVGRGGMGVVYKGRHVFLKTSHAIKVILPELVGSDPGLITRFRQEAMVAASIRHQNVVTVTDFGVAHGRMPFLVMDFIQGQSLQDLLEQEGSLSPEKALEILAPAAAGVSAAHRQHIVHRDLKPLNIMLQDGLPLQEAVKVLDFGLAKIKSGDMFGSFVLAQTTALMGSPFYMAPEQWSEDEPDARADIYSMGVILFQMLSGDVPFKGQSIPIIMKKHMIDNPPTFESLGLDVPLPVEVAVHRALEKEPDKRPQSIEDFVEEFREAVESRSLAATQLLPARPVKKAPATRSSKSRKRTVAAKEPETKPSVEDMMVEAHRHFQEEQDRLAALSEKDKATSLGVTKRGLAKRAKRTEPERTEPLPELPAPTIYIPQPEPKPDNILTQPVLAVNPEPQVTRQETTGILPPEPRGFTTSSDSKPTIQSTPEIQIPWQQSRPSLQASGIGLEIASQKKPLIYIASAAGVGLLLLLVLIVLHFSTSSSIGDKRSTTSSGPSEAAPSGRDFSSSTELAKADMVRVPGGTFMMGRSDVPSTKNQYPAHSVNVSTFYMDKTEVTNAEYAKCVQDYACKAPGDWSGNTPPGGSGLLPVSNVTFDDAQSFAAWRSKRDGVTYRLPTEDEWEYAARGGNEYNIYPWGKQWESGYANVGSSGPKPTGSYPQGASPFGALDMIGNVWEWTSSRNSVYPGNNDFKIFSDQANWVVTRGGSYFNSGRDNDEVTATRRNMAAPTTKHPSLGFRLVRSGQ